MTRIGVILPLLLILAPGLLGVELLENGDFEEDLSLGWTQELGGANYEIDRGTEFRLDPDYEVYVKKYLQEYVMLKQTVPVVGLNLHFCGEVRFAPSCAPNTYGYGAASAIRLLYQNSSGETLGETRIFNGTSDCDWTSAESLHLIEVHDDLWQEVHLLIQDEMEYLPAVNPAEVTQITVGLYCYNTDNC